MLLLCESNERGNNCRPNDEYEAISGNRTCHFTQTNSPFETAAFALGQQLDPSKVKNRGIFLLLSCRCAWFWQSLTTSWLRHTKPWLMMAGKSRGTEPGSNFTMNCWPWQVEGGRRKRGLFSSWLSYKIPSEQHSGLLSLSTFPLLEIIPPFLLF